MSAKCLRVTEGRYSNCVCCFVPRSQCDLRECSLFFSSGNRDENYRASIHNPSHSPWVSCFLQLGISQIFCYYILIIPRTDAKDAASVILSPQEKLATFPCPCVLVRHPQFSGSRLFLLPILLNHPHHPHPICTPHPFILYHWDTLQQMGSFENAVSPGSHVLLFLKGTQT